MKSRIVIDARCLQRPDLAGRGIGLHLCTMLRARPAAAFETVFLLDPALPLPAPECLALADGMTNTAYGVSRHAGLFLQPAPMSLPPGPVLRLLRAPPIMPVAVVLDFIEHDFPDLYLKTPAARRAERRGRAILRHYRRFLPISRATEARLHDLVPSSRGASRVTGVALRSTLIRAAPPPGFDPREGILVVAGDDPRKNAEIVLRAGFDVPLRIAGVSDPARRHALAALHAQAGGAAERLHFLPHLPDADLAEAYARARLVIAPSRAEGFSLPVIEAMAQGTPVLAADEPAQAELVGPEDRFAPDDVAGLRRIAAARLEDRAAWAEARTRQEGVWRDFCEENVAARFWSALGEALPAPAVLRRTKPRIALLTPLPPAQSGCADHSAALLGAMAPLADVTAFSDTPSPALPPGIGFGGTADPTVMRSARFDAVIAVLGNSGFHRTEMRLLLDYGAAAILHDARMMGFYRTSLGIGRARGVAAAELGRDVTDAELDAWDRDQGAMPIRFLGEIAGAAAPLIVHAEETARFVAARHGVAARFLPFAPYRMPAPESLGEAGRQAARATLGAGDDITLVASFGHVHHGKDPFRLIEAYGHLARERRCRFALLGAGESRLVEALRTHAAACGIAGADLVLDAEPVPESLYRIWLAAADIAVQLRRAPPGSISGALMDAVAAGLPAVADSVLVEALAPPGYVGAVQDDDPPDAVAAAVMAVLARGRAGIPAQRAAFLAARGMNRYASQLVEAVLA